MGDLRCVKTFPTPFEAAVARQALEAEGIATRLSTDDPGSMIPYGFGGVQLFVAGADVERALAILKTPQPDA